MPQCFSPANLNFTISPVFPLNVFQHVFYFLTTRLIRVGDFALELPYLWQFLFVILKDNAENSMASSFNNPPNQWDITVNNRIISHIQIVPTQGKDQQNQYYIRLMSTFFAAKEAGRLISLTLVNYRMPRSKTNKHTKSKILSLLTICFKRMLSMLFFMSHSHVFHFPHCVHSFVVLVFRSYSAMVVDCIWLCNQELLWWLSVNKTSSRDQHGSATCKVPALPTVQLLQLLCSIYFVIFMCPLWYQHKDAC